MRSHPAHSVPIPGLRPNRAARALGAAALAAAAALGGVPRPLAAQRTPATAPAAQPATGPCSEAAPARGAVRPDDEMRLLERATVELRAAELRAGESRGAQAGARQRAANVLRVLEPSGYVGLRTIQISDLRVTPLGRVVRYCTYPVVVSVEPASPAHRAGIEQGDTIIAYNERDLVKSGELELDRLLVPGETVRVSLRRDGRQQVRPVVVGRRQITGIVRTWSDDRGNGFVIVTPDGAPMHEGQATVITRSRLTPRAPVAGGAAVAPTPPNAPGAPGATPAPLPPTTLLPGYTIAFGGGPTPLLGAQLIPLDDDLREVLGARDGAGVFVLRVVQGTHAFEAGLRSGDVIRAANGTAVASPIAIQRILATTSQLASSQGAEMRALRLDIERKGQRKTVQLRW